jgi:hypothetical protein
MFGVMAIDQLATIEPNRCHGQQATCMITNIQAELIAIVAEVGKKSVIWHFRYRRVINRSLT